MLVHCTYNHLDMETIDSLLDAVNSFKGAVIIISHDQYFLSGFAKEYWALNSNGEVTVLYDLDEAKEHSYLIENVSKDDEEDGQERHLSKREQKKLLKKQQAQERASKGSSNTRTLEKNLKKISK